MNCRINRKSRMSYESEVKALYITLSVFIVTLLVTIVDLAWPASALVIVCMLLAALILAGLKDE